MPETIPSTTSTTPFWDMFALPHQQAKQTIPQTQPTPNVIFDSKGNVVKQRFGPVGDFRTTPQQQKFNVMRDKLNSIYSTKQFMMLPRDKQQMIRGGIYDKYVKPVYEQYGWWSPSREAYITQPIASLNMTFTGPKESPGLGVEGAGIKTSASLAHGLTEGLRDVGSAAAWVKGFVGDELKYMSQPVDPTGQRPEHTWGQSNEVGNRVSDHFKEWYNHTIAGDMLHSSQTYLDTHYEDSTVKQLAYGALELVGQYPLWEGINKLVKAGSELSGLDKLAGTGRVGKIAADTLHQAATGYIYKTVTGGSQKEALHEGEMFALYGAGFNSLNWLRKSFFGGVLGIGGKPLTSAAIQAAAKMADQPKAVEEIERVFQSQTAKSGPLNIHGIQQQPGPGIPLSTVFIAVAADILNKTAKEETGAQSFYLANQIQKMYVLQRVHEQAAEGLQHVVAKTAQVNVAPKVAQTLAKQVQEQKVTSGTSAVENLANAMNKAAGRDITVQGITEGVQKNSAAKLQQEQIDSNKLVFETLASKTLPTITPQEFEALQRLGPGAATTGSPEFLSNLIGDKETGNMGLFGLKYKGLRQAEGARNKLLLLLQPEKKENALVNKFIRQQLVQLGERGGFVHRMPDGTLKIASDQVIDHVAKHVQRKYMVSLPLMFEADPRGLFHSTLRGTETVFDKSGKAIGARYGVPSKWDLEAQQAENTFMGLIEQGKVKEALEYFKSVQKLIHAANKAEVD